MTGTLHPNGYDLSTLVCGAAKIVLISLDAPYLTINSFPNNKILDLSKYNVFAGPNLNLAKVAKYVFDGRENIMEKEKCWSTALPPFLSVFKRLLSLGC